MLLYFDVPLREIRAGAIQKDAQGAPRLSQQFAVKVQDSAPTTTGRAATRDTQVSYKAIRVGIKPAPATWHEKRGDACLPPRHSGSVRELQKYIRSSEVSMSALRILVADDHEVVRRGLCALLKSHAGWEVCAEAADGREAVHKVDQLKQTLSSWISECRT